MEVSGTLTIVALGLSGDESADDLRRLAEVYEVRYFLTYGDQRKSGAANRDEVQAIERAAWPYVGAVEGETHATIKDRCAEILYAARWRPGMTAEDAARLLAAADRGEAP